MARRGGYGGGELWAVVGGLGLGAASFVPWYDGDLVFEGTRTNGWQEPDALLSRAAVVLGIVVAGLSVLTRGQGRRPHDRPGAPAGGTLLAVASAVVVGLLALKLGLNLDGTTVGVYLALAAAVTQLYGAYLIHLDGSAERSGPAQPSGPVAPSGVLAPGTGPGTPPPSLADTRPPPPAAPEDTRPPPPAAPEDTRPPPPAAPEDTRPPPPGPTVPADPRPQAEAQPPVAQPPVVEPVAEPPVRPQVQAWPETAYFLSAWLQPAPDVEPAVARYRQTFAADPGRLARLSAELGALLDPRRSDTELDALLARHAPRWAGHGGRPVLTRTTRAVAPGAAG